MTRKTQAPSPYFSSLLNFLHKIIIIKIQNYGSSESLERGWSGWGWGELVRLEECSN